MAEIKPRYEFRIWSESLTALRAKLEAKAEARQTKSQETYLISAVTEKSNAKIRTELLDIKVLIDEDRGLEQWRPILKAGFPLSNSAVAEQIFPSLQLTPPALTRVEYTMDEFLEEVMQKEPKIAVVDVAKTRYQFNIGRCAIEYSNITINNVRRDTVAVESTDPNAVLQLVRELGINGPNVSYIREIRRIIGWEAA